MSKDKVFGFVKEASAKVGEVAQSQSKRLKELNEAHGGNVREVAGLVATEVKEGAHYVLDKTVAASESHVDKAANKLTHLAESGRNRAKSAAGKARVSANEAEANGKADKVLAAKVKATAAAKRAKQELSEARDKVKEHHDKKNEL